MEEEQVENTKAPLIEKEASPQKNLSVRAQMKSDPMITQSFLEDKKQGYVYFQDQNLTLAESIMIHLKPSKGPAPSTLFLLFFFDFLLSLAFQLGHIYFFIG